MIPVLDVLGGRAVRAVAGDRAHYGPLRSVLHPGTDPITLARAGLIAWGLRDLYLADLDAIAGAPPDLGLYRAIGDLGLTLWVDAGVRDAAGVPGLLDSGVARLVVGLETVRGPGELAEVVGWAGADRVVFSLDLRDGRPIVDTRAAWGTDRPPEIAARVVELGIRRIIHLDLARVGTGSSPDTSGMGKSFDWLADLALANDGLEWLVGGGIVGLDDLAKLARIGAWGALIGSALHDGRIGAEDLKTWKPRWADLDRGDPPGGRSPAVGPVDDPDHAALVVEVIDHRVDVGDVPEV